MWASHHHRCCRRRRFCWRIVDVLFFSFCFCCSVLNIFVSHTNALFLSDIHSRITREVCGMCSWSSSLPAVTFFPLDEIFRHRRSVIDNKLTAIDLSAEEIELSAIPPVSFLIFISNYQQVGLTVVVLEN